MTAVKMPPKKWNPFKIIDHKKGTPEPFFATERGVLYKGDCLKILPLLNSETIDTVFADPPFNLGKYYGGKVNDNLSEHEYINWCKTWVAECIRILKPGGSFFLYNLPKWNILLGNYLSALDMTFRHWIAINIKAGLPIPGRLYPSHYSLLYFTKGKPKTFKKIRTPIETCRHCGKEIKDYGGYRNVMNPKGVNLTDVWSDIPPVRHQKFKSKKYNANQLSTKLLYRVIRMSTKKHDIVLDPFGGSGTTYYVCEMEGRHWIGIELGNCGVIIERFKNPTLHPHKTEDFVEERV